jgi:hypothetical protein
MQRAALCIPSLIFISVFVFKKLRLVYYVEMKMSRAFSLVYCTYCTFFPCVLSPGLHDDDDEYHPMFCCMIFGMSSAHGSLLIAPVCPIAVNPIMRSGAGDLTRVIWATFPMQGW